MTEMIRPPKWYRVMSAAVAVLITVLAIVFGISEQGPLLPLFAVLAIASAIYLVRGWRAGIELHPEYLVIRGFFRSRRLCKTQLTSVSRFPFLDWADDHGTSHQSVVSVYSGGQNGGGGAGARSEAKLILLQWLKADS